MPRIKVDFFRENANKWYTTEELYWNGVTWEFGECIEQYLKGRLRGMIAVANNEDEVPYPLIYRIKDD